MNNKAIKETLEETFNIPTFYKNITDENFKSWNYFIFKESLLEEKDLCYYSQTIDILYVSENKDTYREIEIIKSMKQIGLVFSGAEYGEYRKSNANQYIDTVLFHFKRPIKVNS